MGPVSLIALTVLTRGQGRAGKAGRRVLNAADEHAGRCAAAVTLNLGPGGVATGQSEKYDDFIGLFNHIGRDSKGEEACSCSF